MTLHVLILSTFYFLLQHFRLKVKNIEEMCAPGLGISAVVLYEPSSEEEMKDRIIITVDGEVIEVPIYGYAFFFLFALW
jgi:hypothetical protein